MTRPAVAGVTVPVRTGLIALTVISILATAFELASERHWNGIEQLIPWVALGILTVATGLLAGGPVRAVPAVRVLAVLILAVSAYGVVTHVLVNHDAGPLDALHGPGWDALPAVQQWWYALTKTVGPAPVLAPGVLGQASLLLLLASLTGPRRAR